MAQYPSPHVPVLPSTRQGSTRSRNCLDACLRHQRDRARVPSRSPRHFPNEVPTTPPQGGDLDWGIESEERYPPYFLKSDKNIAESREAYYKALPKHLKDARDLARGLREPSKIEKNDPSKTESEFARTAIQEGEGMKNGEMGFDIFDQERCGVG